MDKRMKVYITGIAGFLGSHIADYWLEHGADVSGCDNFIGGTSDNITSNKIIVDHLDITKGSEALSYMTWAMENADVVYHCAAAPYEGISVFSPSYITENIFYGSVNVFTAAIKAGVKRIVYCSSMARYGNINPPFDELDTPYPQDPYGIAKEAAERVLKCLALVHNIEWVIAVPHNIYGPRQKYDDPYRNVASIMINRMLQGKQPIIYGDGEQKRCFSYISDCISCLAKMGTENLHGHVINIGPDEGTVTINQLAQILADIIGFDLNPIYYAERPQEVKEARCSSDLARYILGYKTEVNLKKGMTMFVDWIESKGPLPFQYNHVPLEIINDKTPLTWKNKEV